MGVTMAAEILGYVTCPHCGNESATVHAKARGKYCEYYRCYEGAGGATPQCGTVQIHGPKGQEWIKRNIRPINAKPVQMPKGSVAANDPAPEPKGSEEQQQKPAAKMGWLDNFLKGDDE